MNSPHSLILSLRLNHRYPRGFAVHPVAAQPTVFTLRAFRLCRGLAARSTLVRSMRSLLSPLIAILAVLCGLTGCDKSPAAKFKPGNKVTTIMGTEGVVWCRTRFFVDDVYYLRVPLTDDENASYVHCPELMPAYELSGPYDPADLRLVAE